MIKTRFAPSPTGYLHIGGVRTALFCWLYAKQQQGQFVLRIEDTDKERSTQASVQAIFDGMRWLNLEYDEGPYYQTQRLERYQAIVQQLINDGHAYRCTCSQTRLDALREQQMANRQKPKYDGHCRDAAIKADHHEPYVVRFKTPLEGQTDIHDLVKGTVTIDHTELDDMIIARSDGTPTYNLAVTVDDMDMQITHVIRGDDHLNNTPRQILLYQALSAELPAFAHVPMIVGHDGKRLSKRHGAVSVIQYQEEGILPAALLNYLVRLGWSHGDQEIFTQDEMIEYFDFKHISRSPATFDHDKLLWLNQQYLIAMSDYELAETARPFYQQTDWDLADGPELELVVPLLKERSQTLQQLVEQSRFFYQPISYDDSKVVKQLQAENAANILNVFETQISQLSEWHLDAVQQAIADTMAELGLKMGKVGPKIRAAVCGTLQAPSLDATLFVLGKTKVTQRLQQCQQHLSEL